MTEYTHIVRYTVIVTEMVIDLIAFHHEMYVQIVFAIELRFHSLLGSVKRIVNDDVFKQSPSYII